MRGSVVKKGDRYYVKIELDADPETGRRRQKWHSGYRTKREAERARVDLLSKVDRGEYVEPSQQTLAEFLEEWLRAIEPTLRPSTFDSYSRNVRNHISAHIGSVRLTKVDAGTLNGLYARLLASGRRRPSRTGCGYSSAVVERALELRLDSLTLSATAERLRADLPEADTSRKTRWRASFGATRQRPSGRGTATAGASTRGPSTTSTRSSTEPSKTPSAGAGSAGTRATPPTHRGVARSPTGSSGGTRRHSASS